MIEVRSATADEAGRIGAVLARAFHPDPGTILIEPDDARRAAVLPLFFATWVTAAIADGGDLVVPVDELSGVASWFGPDRHGPSPDALGAAGFGRAFEAFGPDATARMLAMTGELEAQHDRWMTEPHLRLEFFGVEPAAQGRGIGVALAEHGHRRADERGLPCYLETFTEKNVRFYERSGYRVLGTYTVGDDVPVFAMRREPRSRPTAAPGAA